MVPPEVTILVGTRKKRLTKNLSENFHGETSMGLSF